MTGCQSEVKRKVSDRRFLLFVAKKMHAVRDYSVIKLMNNRFSAYITILLSTSCSLIYLNIMKIEGIRAGGTTSP